MLNWLKRKLKRKSDNLFKGRFKLGWIPDVPDKRDHIFSVKLGYFPLPLAVDLRKKCPPVYNQLNLGSCVGNATGACVQFERMRQSFKDFVPSRLFIYYNARDMEGTILQDSGCYIRDAIKSLARHGVCPETEWPYIIKQFSTKPSNICYESALKYKVVEYIRLEHNLEQMKKCLADGFPFACGVSVYDSFPEDGNGDIPMPGNNEKMHGGHAIAICGYTETDQTFIVRNSWGESWGKSGYGTISYDYLTNSNLADDFWTIRVVSG